MPCASMLRLNGYRAALSASDIVNSPQTPPRKNISHELAHTCMRKDSLQTHGHVHTPTPCTSTDMHIHTQWKFITNSIARNLLCFLEENARFVEFREGPRLFVGRVAGTVDPACVVSPPPRTIFGLAAVPREVKHSKLHLGYKTQFDLLAKDACMCTYIYIHIYIYI